MIASTRVSSNIQKLHAITRAESVGAGSFAQRRWQAHVGFDAPLTGSEQRFLGATSLSASGDFEEVSGVGGLPAYDLTFQWRPNDDVSVSIGRTITKSQPMLDTSREPVSYSPGALIVDVATGRSALVTRISGGTPDLRASSQAEDRFGLTFNGTVRRTAISTTLDYSSTAIENPVILTAYPTPLFQQMFPRRFARDPDGRLTTIDVRPFNGVEERKTLIRLSGHASGHFAGDDGDWDVSLSHDWTLSDRLDPGQASHAIDLLATPLDGVQGPRRRQADLDVSASYKQIRFQLGAKWRAGETTEDISALMPNETRYGDLLILNMELSYTFKATDRTGNAEGKPLRLWISVENAFDQRLSVRTSNGVTPSAFQPAFLDPIGRVVMLRLSKTL